MLCVISGSPRHSYHRQLLVARTQKTQLSWFWIIMLPTEHLKCLGLQSKTILDCTSSLHIPPINSSRLILVSSALFSGSGRSDATKSSAKQTQRFQGPSLSSNTWTSAMRSSHQSSSDQHGRKLGYGRWIPIGSRRQTLLQAS